MRTASDFWVIVEDMELPDAIVTLGIIDKTELNLDLLFLL